MKTLTNNTWLNYIASLGSKSNGSDIYDPQLLHSCISSNVLASSFFNLANPVIYVLDYRYGRYLKMSGNFGGYPADLFLNKGLGKFIEIYDKHQFKIFDEQIFPDRIEFLSTIDYREHKNFVFSCNLTIINNAGMPTPYLQRNFYLSNPAGQPLISIGIFIAMEHLNYGSQMVQTVHHLGSDGMMLNEPVAKKTYQAIPSEHLFSKREKEVLLWMADGLSSKMIARKLFLSEHTVINHRRNMHDKTKCANALALIKYAIKNGAI